MKHDYKLIFFDIDGTLRVEGKGYIPATTKEAISRLKQKQIPLVICTARSLDGIPENVMELGFEYYICYNGAVIYDQNGTVIKDSGITVEDAKRLKAYYKQNNETYVYKFLSGLKIKYGNDPWEDFTARYFKKPLSKQFQAFRLQNIEVDLDEEKLLFGTAKLLPDSADDIRREFPRLTFTQVFDNYYDFTSNEANKGIALQYICDRLGISSDCAMAFGDGLNDILMFESVGLAVAMGNAVDKVKAHADYVTDDIEQDGIANAIHHFFPSL